MVAKILRKEFSCNMKIYSYSIIFNFIQFIFKSYSILFNQFNYILIQINLHSLKYIYTISKFSFIQSKKTLITKIKNKIYLYDK